MLLVALGLLLGLQTENSNGTFGERLESALRNFRSNSRVHEVATTRVTRVTRVPGPASATCTVVVCLQFIHSISLGCDCE